MTHLLRAFALDTHPLWVQLPPEALNITPEDEELILLGDQLFQLYTLRELLKGGVTGKTRLRELIMTAHSDRMVCWLYQQKMIATPRKPLKCSEQLFGVLGVLHNYLLHDLKRDDACELLHGYMTKNWITPNFVTRLQTPELFLRKE